MELSTRTISKIMSRAKLGCVLCGWNNAKCDIHHIKDISFGGTNDMTNLIYVCPNHHREIHQKRDKHNDYSVETLSKNNLLIQFPNWKSYYNPRSDHERVSLPCGREGCLNRIQSKSNKYCCMECYNKDSKLNTLPMEEFIKILNANNFNLEKTGRMVGVSGSAIRKYCKKHNIDCKKSKFERSTKNKRISL